MPAKFIITVGWCVEQRLEWWSAKPECSNWLLYKKAVTVFWFCAAWWWTADSEGESSKHETMNQCWVNAGPPSATAAQHWPSIDWMSRVFAGRLSAYISNPSRPFRRRPACKSGGSPAQVTSMSSTPNLTRNPICRSAGEPPYPVIRYYWREQTHSLHQCTYDKFIPENE